MLNFFKQNQQFLIMLILWVLAGIASPYLAFVIITLSILLLKQKGKYIELLIGFLFILIISDSRNPIFYFAATAKSIYLVLLTLLFLFDNKKFTSTNHFFLPFVPFFIVALLSLINSPIPALASQKTLSYMLLYFTIPVYINKGLTENKEVFLRYLVFISSLMLLFGFILAIATPHYSFLANRLAGIFGNPNGVGLFCSINFVLVSVIFNKYPNIFTANEKKVVYGIIIASVLFSVSRNSVFSILIFILFVRFYNISGWLGFIIVILVALLYQVITMNLITIITALGLEEYFRLDTLESGSGRLVAWNFAWGYIKEHFIFGSGFAFDEHLFDIHQKSLNQLGHVGGVHNLYFAMWLNTGAIGLVCFLYGFFKTISKAVKVSKLAMPIMFSFLFSLTFEGWLMGSLNPYNIGWVFTMVILLYQPINEPKAEHSLS